MKNKLFALLLLSCFAGALTGQDAVSNADLARKLDLILLKVDSLEKRVNAIESKPATRPAATAPAPHICPAYRRSTCGSPAAACPATRRQSNPEGPTGEKILLPKNS